MAAATVGLAALSGCTAKSGTTALASASTPQRLPLVANIKMNGQVVLLEEARTAEQQATGLMFRTDLPRDRGMIFPAQPPRVISIWMKNTLIPLDVIFLRNGVITKIDANVQPCTTDECASYSSETEVDHVIELAAGRTAELALSAREPLKVNEN